LNGSVHQLSIFLFFFRPVKVCCFDGNFLYLILQRVYTGMVAVTGRTCYDRIRIFEVKRYFLIDITESRGQIMQKNYVQEILNIIHGNIPQAELAEKLSDYHEKDLADALEALMPAERKSLYPILGVDEVAEIFAYLDDAEPYLKELSRDEAAKVISNMDSDDAADALEDLGEIDKGEIVNKLDRDSIEDVKMLLSYSEDEIGSKMTTNYIRIKNDMTIRQAMSELVKQAGENDNISVLYVVDENEHFYGAIDLKDLIIARAEDPLAELIVGSYPYVTDREKISDCIERIVDYAERSLPVLNEAGKLMGIITSSDVVELVDDEMSDDYAKLGGLTGEEDLNENVFESVKKRLPWLIALLFLGMLVSSVVGAFESVVAVLPVVIWGSQRVWTKGKPKRISAGVGQLVFSPLRRHSQKPAEVRDKIVELMGDLPRIELFAREAAPGWDVWGNEAPTPEVKDAPADSVELAGKEETHEPDDQRDPAPQL